jgi:hypothetical protein
VNSYRRENPGNRWVMNRGAVVIFVALGLDVVLLIVGFFLLIFAWIVHWAITIIAILLILAAIYLLFIGG